MSTVTATNTTGADDWETIGEEEMKSVPPPTAKESNAPKEAVTKNTMEKKETPPPESKYGIPTTARIPTGDKKSEKKPPQAAFVPKAEEINVAILHELSLMRAEMQTNSRRMLALQAEVQTLRNEVNEQAQRTESHNIIDKVGQYKYGFYNKYNPYSQYK